MSAPEPDRRQAFAQVMASFVEIVATHLGTITTDGTADTGNAAEMRLAAALEGSLIVKSFIASDRMYLATELVPMYQVMSDYLREYAPGANYEAMLDVDEHDDAGIFRQLDLWKYSPSPLFESLLRCDSQDSSRRSLDYGELGLALAAVVCELDGRVVSEERYDLKQFEQMLVNEVEVAGVASARSFDSAGGRWLIAGRQSERPTVYSLDHPHDPVLDELVSTFFAPRVSLRNAREMAESFDHPCVTPGCRNISRHGQVRCDACSELLTAVRISGSWREIEVLGNGSEVAPAEGCDCGAIYLTVNITGVRAQLHCPFCQRTYSLRRVRRYLVDS